MLHAAICSRAWIYGYHTIGLAYLELDFPQALGQHNYIDYISSEMKGGQIKKK